MNRRICCRKNCVVFLQIDIHDHLYLLLFDHSIKTYILCKKTIEMQKFTIALDRNSSVVNFRFVTPLKSKLKTAISDVFPCSPYFTFLGPYKQDTEFDLKLWNYEIRANTKGQLLKSKLVKYYGQQRILNFLSRVKTCFSWWKIYWMLWTMCLAYTPNKILGIFVLFILVNDLRYLKLSIWYILIYPDVLQCYVNSIYSNVTVYPYCILTHA